MIPHNSLRRVGSQFANTCTFTKRVLPFQALTCSHSPFSSSLLGRRYAHTVYATDPRFIMDKYSLREYDDDLRAETGARAFLKLELTDQLYQDLKDDKIEFMLAEGDDPGNFYVLGKHGELFEYDFLGNHAALSGLTTLVSEETAEDAIVNAATVSTSHEEWDTEERDEVLQQWKQFHDKVFSLMKETQKRKVTMEDHPEFLFLGQVLHAPSMAVYTLGKGEMQKGIMLHSEDNAEED